MSPSTQAPAPPAVSRTVGRARIRRRASRGRSLFGAAIPTFHTTEITRSAQSDDVKGRCRNKGARRANLVRSHRRHQGAHPGPDHAIGGATDPDRSLMTRIIRSVGFVLALATVGLGGGALAWTASSPAAAQSGATRPCRRDGSCASWKASPHPPPRPTSPTSTSGRQPRAVRPTTRRRSTPSTRCGRPMSPEPRSPGWTPPTTSRHSPPGPPGCSATVATLFQPNMWVITAALRAGNVTPASAFLAVVDQSAWCAVSPAGVPCYVNEVLSGAEPARVAARLVGARRLRQRDIGPAGLPAVDRDGLG